MPEMDDLRYPIGDFQWPAEITPAQRRDFIHILDEAPAKLRAAVAALTDAQLDTPYRPGGWTVRQVVHHLPDSHMNSYIRFKLALTEDQPRIKPYDEARWAQMHEARTAPVEVSLHLMDALHRRWVLMLENMTDADFTRAFEHPERGIVRLDGILAMYAWHCRHHVAHILALRKRMGWLLS
jgi:uncharacterized damage-inducible protein DinB